MDNQVSGSVRVCQSLMTTIQRAENERNKQKKSKNVSRKEGSEDRAPFAFTEVVDSVTESNASTGRTPDESQQLALRRAKRGKGAVRTLKSGKSIPLRLKTAPVTTKVKASKLVVEKEFKYYLDNEGEPNYSIFAIVFKTHLKKNDKRRVSMAKKGEDPLAVGDWLHVVFDPKDLKSRPKDLIEASHRNLYHLVHDEDIRENGAVAQLILNQFEEQFDPDKSQEDQEHDIFEWFQRFWEAANHGNLGARRISNLNFMENGISIEQLRSLYTSDSQSIVYYNVVNRVKDYFDSLGRSSISGILKE